MFFSTEIPKESSACDDLGVFISLEKSPDEWADEILQVVKKNIPIRKGKTEEVKAAGFDSSVEANELLKYYEGLIASMNWIFVGVVNLGLKKFECVIDEIVLL